MGIVLSWKVYLGMVLSVPRRYTGRFFLAFFVFPFFVPPAHALW